jgi:hypothetical protein
VVKELCEKQNVRVSDKNLLIAHQAILRIDESVQKTLGLRDDQVFNNIQHYGNTTAAIIPIAFDECLKQVALSRGIWSVSSAWAPDSTGEPPSCRLEGDVDQRPCTRLACGRSRVFYRTRVHGHLPGRASLKTERLLCPRLVAEQLLDLLETDAADWKTARVLDPACGGGAFSSPVAH